MTAIPSSFRSNLSVQISGLVICAWCGEELIKPEAAPNLPRDSHGICPGCALKHFGLDLAAILQE